jgi:hypothetical protein
MKKFHVCERTMETDQCFLPTQAANPAFCSFKVWCMYYKFLGFGIICGSCSHSLGIGTMRDFCQCITATNLKV